MQGHLGPVPRHLEDVSLSVVNFARLSPHPDRERGKLSQYSRLVWTLVNNASGAQRYDRPPFVSPPFLGFQWGLRQWAERKRRGPLTLETWLSLVEITLETFGKQRQVAYKLPPPPATVRRNL